MLGYGHASVAEHAVVHLAVENVSRLACDTLEDNRLASYTEKSSRYQVMPEDYYHVPEELAQCPDLKKEYEAVCHGLFQCYMKLIDGCMDYLRETTPRIASERDGAFNLRLRRMATDHCRAVLPAATLTNVGCHGQRPHPGTCHLEAVFFGTNRGTTPGRCGERAGPVDNANADQIRRQSRLS